MHASSTSHGTRTDGSPWSAQELGLFPQRFRHAGLISLLHALLMCWVFIPPLCAVDSPSPKKGVGLWFMDNVNTSSAALRVAWTYDWASSPAAQGYTPPPGSAFIPMIWDEQRVTTQELNRAKGFSNTLLGFNEPDRTNEANMSVEQALDLWPQLMATGMRLGSPAPAAAAADAGAWLDRFMQGVQQRNYRVDFICIHWYGHTQATYDNPAASTRALTDYIAAVHAKFRKPVWLTEFALRDWTVSTPATQDQQAAFVRTVLPALERIPYLERYAWYVLNPDDRYNSALGRADGSLTNVGIAYRDTAVYPAGIPAVPQALSVLSSTPSQATLSWIDQAGNDAGARIERRLGNGSWTEIGALFAPNQTSFEDSGLSAGSLYTYRVRYFNHDGYSAYSNESSLTLGGVASYTVSYNANGATGGTVPASQTKTHDASLTLKGNTGGLVRTGFSFNGWNTAANGTGTAYAAAATYTGNGPLTLHARWIPQDSSPGLQAVFFNNSDLSDQRVRRIDESIDFAWGHSAPAAGIDQTSFSARWTGIIQSPYSEVFTFHATTDDGVRLWINGRLLIDQWADQAATEWSGSIPMEAMQSYAVVVEYFQSTGPASARLEWSSRSTPRQTVPAGMLFHAAMPDGWLSDRIGRSGSPGAFTCSGNVFTATAYGSGDWQGMDSGEMTAQEITGNCTIVAKIASLQAANPWARAGVSLRQDSSAGAKQVFCGATAGHGIGFHYRKTANGLASYISGSRASAPQWVKIVRSGSLVTGYESSDGVTWEVVGKAALEWSNPIRVGLYVTSQDPDLPCTAVIEQVIITPDGAG